MAEIDSKKDNSISDIHDIKETATRGRQFCYVAIIAAFFKVIINVIHGNRVSALLDLGLIIVLVLMVWVIIKKDPRVANYVLIISLNTFFILIAFAEGLNSASTLYFLPLLYAIPFFINNHGGYKLQVSIFFTVTLMSFAFCILFCPRVSSWQNISDTVFHQMFIANCFSAFALCGIFAYLSIYLERKYAFALVGQITKTEEALNARSKFLSNMGHELRTPLNGIIGATNLLRNQRSLPEQKEYIDILKYCSDHMLGLVNDILDFNKIEAGLLELHPEQTNIKKLLEQSTLPFYNSFEEKKIELLVCVDDRLDDELVLVDDLRLVQVLNNLISNALKFTEKGFVKLEVTQTKKKNNIATILFSVTDTGIGIGQNDQEKIFGSFWQVYDQSTRKYGGTGLGLTISEKLLKRMNASLSVESEPGKGSRFYFSINVPVVASVEEKTKIPLQKNNDLEGIRILLAEDNIINMMIAKKFLEDKKAILTTAENGQVACDHLEKDSGYDIILLDLEMPVMDGYTAVVKICERYPHIPVVAFTAALMDQEMLQRLLGLGFLDCILKPFQPLDFYAKVRKYANLKIVATQ